MTEAVDYVSVLGTAGSAREAARSRLAAIADENTDALNFLGVAALADGDADTARELWVRSADQEDTAAPVLLYLSRLDGHHED